MSEKKPGFILNSRADGITAHIRSVISGTMQLKVPGHTASPGEKHSTATHDKIKNTVCIFSHCIGLLS